MPYIRVLGIRVLGTRVLGIRVLGIRVLGIKSSYGSVEGLWKVYIFKLIYQGTVITK